MTDLSRAKTFVNSLPVVQMKPDELAHYGVLGMHWGYRKPESVERDERLEKHIRNTKRKLAVGTLGASVVVPKAVSSVQRRRAAAKAKLSDDHKAFRELAKKHPRHLSNAEIDKIVARLQKEQKLKQLRPDGLSRGKKAALSVVATLGTITTVAGFVNSKPGQATVVPAARALINTPAGQRAVATGAKIVAAIIRRGR